MTKDTQPTKPSAEDRAVALYNRVFSPDASYFDWKDGESYKVYCIRVCQEAIEAHETAVAELLEAAKLVASKYSKPYSEPTPDWVQLKQAIAKCERSE